MEKFNFYQKAELKKGKEGDKDVYYFRGLASDSSRDSDGQALDPSIFDLSEFKYVNWDHGKDPDDIIGEQVKNWVDKNGIMMEGVLYPDLPKGKSTIRLMKALEKSPNGNRLGLSIEGQILERDLLTKEPKRAKVTSVALCPFPKNGNTWADLIQKSKSVDSLYQDPKELVYDVDKNDPTNEVLLIFIDETGNRLILKKDFSFDIEKAQTTENSRPLIKEDVEGSKKKFLTLIKAHKAQQITDEQLRKVLNNINSFVLN